jgi:tellurite methyltransferase
VTQHLIQELVLRRPATVPLLDTRRRDAFERLHLIGSSHIAAHELTERASELPPKGTPISVIVEAGDVSAVELVLVRLGYLHNQLVISSDELWTKAAAMTEFVESGAVSARMWRPSAFLAQWVELIESRLNRFASSSGYTADGGEHGSGADSSAPGVGARGVRTALDLACGSGRDAIFLSERGWRVTAIDYLPQLLERCAALCQQYRVDVPTLINGDIEVMHRDKPLHEHFGVASFDLIHVSRYLHRPLYESLRQMVRPGGFIVYSTFMRGCEELGKPRRPQFILEINELKQVFGPEHGFFVYEYSEKRLDDYRPLQHICAQKLTAEQVKAMLAASVKRAGAPNH